jgi:hypothetical protein
MASLFSSYITVNDNSFDQRRKNSHLKKAVETSPEMSPVSIIGHFVMQ